MRKFKISLILALVICISIPSVIVYASHYNANGFSGALHLKYWRDASVATYGYHNRVDNNYDAWNNISTKVNVTEVTSDDPYAMIAVYAGPISGSTVYARAQYYTYGLFGYTQVNPADYRDRAKITLNTPYMKLLDIEESIDVIIHEFGHALSLKHNDDDGDSVMSEFDLTTFGAPTAVDKSHLKSKWGN